ncbi:MAG: type II toxin-antitoxin system RelB/DinJ family antitoxin [bacterium]|nr:type II toxin-antitoxin system RelB/DinJ family antitoxin [bacterium]
MAKTATIRARIEPQLKSEAENILAQLGLTATQAVTLFFRQLVLQRRLPFELVLPNAITLRTFAETDRGENLVRCEDLEELFDKLEI